MTGLSPFTIYSFRVVAVNSLGISLPSKESYYIVTLREGLYSGTLRILSLCSEKIMYDLCLWFLITKLFHQPLFFVVRKIFESKLYCYNFMPPLVLLAFSQTLNVEMNPRLLCLITENCCHKNSNIFAACAFYCKRGTFENYVMGEVRLWKWNSLKGNNLIKIFCKIKKQKFQWNCISIICMKQRHEQNFWRGQS